MGILDSTIDTVTNAIGDTVDATSTNSSATPGELVQSASGTSYFNGVDDALNNLGKELKSPAFSKVDSMKAAGESLNVTDNLDQYTLEQGFGADGTAMWETMQEVQDFSDSLNSCGQLAQDALEGATKDYIKNTGIQQAGRELSKSLGKADDMIDCVAGFATLFDSAGVMDDAMGLGDLPQIQSRVQSIIRDATDPSKLSNMLINTQAVQGLLGDFQGMCDAMTKSLKDLAEKDIAAMNAAINKLAQWAAFAKIATSDPCALVNNNKMLSHITEPVMDDIVTLYNKATNSNASADDPIIDLGDILGIDDSNKKPQIPKLTQGAGGGLLSFDAFSSNLPSGGKSCVCHGGDAFDGNEADCVAHGGEWRCSVVGETGTTISVTEVIKPTEYNPDTNTWDIIPDAVKQKSPLTQNILSGSTPFNNSKEMFTENAKEVEHIAATEDKTAVAKVHKVGWCSGGNFDPMTNRTEEECAADPKATWHEREMTDAEVKQQGALTSSLMGAFSPSLVDTFKKIAESAPTQPSVASEPTKRPPTVVTKSRTELPGLEALTGMKPVAVVSPSQASPQKESADPEQKDPPPFTVDNIFSGEFDKPGYQQETTGASFQDSVQMMKSNIGGDISEYHQSMEAVDTAMETGDWSNVETCSCKPKPGKKAEKGTGDCDYTNSDERKWINLHKMSVSQLEQMKEKEKRYPKEYFVVNDELYQDVSETVLRKYGTLYIKNYDKGSATCEKWGGTWIGSSDTSGTSGGSSTYDITNARSKTVCENVNGQWVCKKGTKQSGNPMKSVESFGLFTNRKNVSPKSRLPSTPAFDTKKLPSIDGILKT